MAEWKPKIRTEYVIRGGLYREALDYALRSGAYTSDRHDFHAGGLSNKQQKMLEGKLGEKAFKLFLLDNGIRFEEDHSRFNERDEYDFLLRNPVMCLRLDVKTRTEPYHIRTLELVEQAASHPKEIYISARLCREQRSVRLLGRFTRQDMLTRGRIENQGYLDNYVMYDRQLRPMEELAWFCHRNFAQ